MGTPRRDRRQWEHELARLLLIAQAAASGAGANPHEAQEAAQTTVANLWEKWDRSHIKAARQRGQNRWDGYVRRSARNVHYDLVRQHQRRIERQERAATCESRVGDYGAVSDAYSTDASDIEACMARAVICEEIQKLPDRQRQVAALIWFSEMSSREVAEQLGIQPQSVRKHLSAARASLRNQLVEPSEDP